MTPRLTLVTGQAQTGKTTLAVELLRSAPRLVVLDPVRSKPFTRSIADGELVPVGTAQELFSWIKAAGDGPYRLALRSKDYGDYVLALRLAEYLRNVVFLVDEGFTLCSSRDVLDALTQAARANAHFGGGLGVPIIITAQRPHDLPPDIRSQADAFVSFRQTEPRDVAFLAQRATPEFAESVAQLDAERHGFLVYPANAWPGGGAYAPATVARESRNEARSDAVVGDGGGGGPADRLPARPAGEPDREAAVDHDAEDDRDGLTARRLAGTPASSK